MKLQSEQQAVEHTLKEMRVARSVFELLKPELNESGRPSLPARVMSRSTTLAALSWNVLGLEKESCQKLHISNICNSLQAWPEWWAILAILGRNDNGIQIFHTCKNKRYSTRPQIPAAQKLIPTMDIQEKHSGSQQHAAPWMQRMHCGETCPNKEDQLQPSPRIL